MALKAKDVEMSYNFANVVSPENPDMKYFTCSKQTFDEDGNVLISIKDKRTHQLQNFWELYKLAKERQEVGGVKRPLSHLPT